MGNSRQRADAIRAYIRRLGNPYAKLQLDDVASKELGELTLAATENPYATDYYRDDSEFESGCSKALFESACRQIFVMYVPEAERPRLREALIYPPSMLHNEALPEQAHEAADAGRI